MAKKYTVVHKKSTVVTGDDKPKVPSASTLQYGEIAVNYADGYETLSIRNSSDEIATFSSDRVMDNFLLKSQYEEDEEVIAVALNDLNSRIPEKVSDLTNDSGFITGYTETDPTVPAWAKAANKPSYTASEVGAMATSERNNYLTTATTIPTEASIEASGFTKNALTGYTETDPTVPAWAKAASKPSYTAAEVGAMATSERGNYLTTATTIPNVDNYFDDVEYDSGTKRINFKHGATVKDYIDATDFIKDGMVSSVTVSNGNLVITFNTDAGREDITLSLSQIFNPENYYDKTAADGKFLTGYTETDPTVPAWAKAASKPTYTAAEVGAMATSERSNYSTTAHTHTAAEVGAMATSERGNYLTTATTIPTEASIEASGFTKNALTGYTETDPTVPAWAKEASKPSYTAAEVGAMATSERGNYSTTGHTHSQYSLTSHTHTAAEVGAMATSERGNYSTTGHTHDYLPLSGGDLTDTLYVIDPSNDTTNTAIDKDRITFGSSSDASRIFPYWKSGNTITIGGVSAYLPNKTGMLAMTDDIPTEANLTSSGFTKNGLTSADTANVFLAISGTTTYDELNRARTAGKVLLAKNDTNYVYTCDGETYGIGFKFTHVSQLKSNNVVRTRVRVLICDTSSQWSEETYILADDMSISGSGYTKNAITGINVNGTAATVTNGVAEITVQSGGSTLPSVTAADNGKVLMVVNGAWAAVMPTTVYTGTDTPLSSIGNDGDIYLQTS